jgi:hypothetical protein
LYQRATVSESQDALARQEHELIACRHRLGIVESLMRRQQRDAERNSKRIDYVKTKHQMFKNAFTSIGKRVNSVREGKEKVDNEIQRIRHGKRLLLRSYLA